MSNVKISALPVDGTLVDSDVIPVVRGGVTGSVNTGTAMADVTTLKGQIATTLVGPAAGEFEATAGSNVYGPIYKLGRPDLVAWSWQNQGTATVTDAHGLSFMTVPSAVSNIRSRLITAPARPYTVTGLFRNNGIGANNQYCGPVFRESGTGKLYIYYLLVQATLQATKWTNDTTFNNTGIVNTSVATLSQNWHWLRMTDDGVNLIFLFSTDGVNYMTMGTEGRTVFMAGGPDQVGFFGNTDNGSQFTFTCASWVQS